LEVCVPFDPGTALCVTKLCVSAASLLGAAGTDQPLEQLKDIFEALSSGSEVAEKLRGPEAHTFVNALRAAEKDVQAAYEESLRKQHSPGFGETIAVAFANFAEVFDKCLPPGAELARLGHDPISIGEWVADAASARRMDVFKDGEGRRMLVGLVALAYERLDKNPAFLAALQRANWRALFDDLGAIRAEIKALREIVDRLTRELGLHETEKLALVADLARVKAEFGSTLSLVAGFLETIVGKQVPADQFAATLFKIAADWRSAGERIGALEASRNLSPEIADLRNRAKEAFAAGCVTDVERLLAKVEQIERDAIARLEAHEAEIKAEFAVRREGFVETKRARLALARARLRHEEAAALIAEIVDLTEQDEVKRFEKLRAEQDKIYVEGRDRGLNAELDLAIAVARIALSRARNADQRGKAGNDLGIALCGLGERERGTARLEEGVAAHRAALEERTRERVPLDWSMTQSNLGLALMRLGERESGTARLEEAVAAHRAALLEQSRERVPGQWAQTQMNLGGALLRLGERESGTARLEEAVAAYRAALEEATRERFSLIWARTQWGLGFALERLGERESRATLLEEAVKAYRAALEELTRDRVPLEWAMTQNNLGNALKSLATGESRTEKLEEAASAYRAALEELTRDRVPLGWATQQNNLGGVLALLGEQESGTMRLEEAVAAFRLALQERKRERVPLDWAMTQNNLGNALAALGARESGTARLEAAAAAFSAALEEYTRERVPLYWAGTSGNQGVAMMLIADRANDAAQAETAATQIETAYATLREGGHAQSAAFFQEQLPKAQAVRDRLKKP
jgi:tetratricopeptide (TPR) repeat protein